MDIYIFFSLFQNIFSASVGLFLFIFAKDLKSSKYFKLPTLVLASSGHLYFIIKFNVFPYQNLPPF